MARISVIWVLFAALFSGAPSYAQQSLSEVLEAIEKDHTKTAPSETSPSRKFQSDPDKMRRQIAEAYSELNAAEQKGAELESWARANNERIIAKKEELRENARAFGEMLGQFRYAAGNTRKKLELSLARFEYPDRTGELKRVAESRKLPTHADLAVLPQAILAEMRAQSEVKRVRLSDVLNVSTDGSFTARDLIRVGTNYMATADTGEYVNGRILPFLAGSPSRLAVFSGEQVENFSADLKDLSDAAPGEVVRIPFDPKQGMLLHEGIFGQRD